MSASPAALSASFTGTSGPPTVVGSGDGATSPNLPNTPSRRSAAGVGAPTRDTQGTVQQLAMCAANHISALLMNPLQANVFLLVSRDENDDSEPSTPAATPATPTGISVAETAADTSTTSTTTAASPSSKRIPAHKAILAAASPTFASMFASGMAESADNAEIQAPYSESIMECVLSYMYCAPERCVALLTNATAMEVLDAACFYRLEPLKDAAITAVIELFTSSNVLPVLTAAVRYDSPRLREHCIGFIRQHNTNVLGSSYWSQLPLEVALLLVRETVIESDLNLLRSCLAWCRAQTHLAGGGANNDAVRDLLAGFLPYINFTAMTMAEMDEVEALGVVPVDVLYKAFKSHSLGGAPTWAPRHGGIVLQWEMTFQETFHVNNNHVVKASQNFVPCTITAMNKFSAGCHYWYVSVVDLRAKHDCLIGVRSKRRLWPGFQSAGANNGRVRSSDGNDSVNDGSQSSGASPRTANGLRAGGPGSTNGNGNGNNALSRAGGEAQTVDYDVEIKFEPCCNTVTAIPSSLLRITRGPECPEHVLGADYCCVIGICVDYNMSQVRFYDHATKTLLYTVDAVVPDDMTSAEASDASARLSAPGELAPLPSPLYPCATLYHRTNGGVVLSDTTTYLGERAVPASIAARGEGSDSHMSTPKKSTLFVGRSPMARPAHANPAQLPTLNSGTHGNAGI
jgi:hypothetical protein